MQDITNNGGIIGFICVLSDYTIKRSTIHVYRISVRDSLLSLRAMLYEMAVGVHPILVPINSQKGNVFVSYIRYKRT